MTKRITDSTMGIKKLVYILLYLIFIAGGVSYSLKKITFDENLSGILPTNSKHQFLVELIDSASFFDKIAFHLYLEDTAAFDPSMLTSVAVALTDSIEKKFVPEYIIKVEGKTDPFIQMQMLESFQKYLPLYMEDADYLRIDSLIEKGDFDKLMKEYIKILNTPAGMMASKFIFSDPMGILPSKLSMLKELQIDNNIILYQNYLFTQDKKHLLFFATPTDASNTAKNTRFLEQLDPTIQSIVDESVKPVKVEYTGSAAMSVANAKQIKKDISITVTIAVILIVSLIFYFFRKINRLILVFLPTFFGATVALLAFALFCPNLSLISLGVGSILMGITVDYGLHLLTHLKHYSDIKETVRKVSVPTLISSMTTAVAFLCLMFLSSPALRQLGMFAAISVIAASICAITFVPMLLSSDKKDVSDSKNTFIEYLAGQRPGNKWIVLTLLGIITLIMLYFSRYAGFEQDIEKSSFAPENLRTAQQHLDSITSISRKKIYLLSSGNNLDEALEKSYSNRLKINVLKNEGKITASSDLNSLILSTSRQKGKIVKWNAYWTSEKVGKLKFGLNKAAVANGFNENAFSFWYRRIEVPAKTVAPDDMVRTFGALINDFIIPLSDRVVVASVLQLDNPQNKEAVIKLLHEEKTFVFDRKDFFINIFGSIKDDFNILSNVSFIVVFLIVLLFFGRIEITFITILPIIISWIWILGIAGLTGLKFNYFNIILCTLIFGLGIDYATFITKGLLQKYKYGQNDFLSYRSSILVGALTTISGLGVLIFARHPAMQSIALLSVVGIVSAMLISFSLQPILFEIIAGSDNKRHRHPVNLHDLLITLFVFGSFGLLSIIVSVLIPFIYIIPAKKSRKRFWMRNFTSAYCGSILGNAERLKFQRVNIDKNTFKNPSVIIANHQSMIDIFIVLWLSPNNLILTKDWVWNNPVFGPVVRFCGHVNITQGYEKVMEILRQRVAEGCSLVVFPEGSRSESEKIQRFHKGGFLIAQELGIPIMPVVINGGFSAMPRNSFMINPGRIVIKKLDVFKIDTHDPRAYVTASKITCALMRKEHRHITETIISPRDYKYRVAGNYTFKGPILENYIRVKLRLENYYTLFHELIPRKAVITDIGCGYGAIDFMLCLCSDERKILAIDYDEEKILVASHCQLATECAVEFKAADALSVEYPDSDIFLISDMLHYLPEDKQRELLKKCIDKLNPGGMLIIRDADTHAGRKHKRTRFSEFLSTNIGFNKKNTSLTFFSKQFIEQISLQHMMDFEIKDPSKLTSNVVYILKKKQNG